MAFYPCDSHGAAYRGPSCAAYPALVNGAETERKHLRLCPDCFEMYLVQLREALSEVDYGPNPKPAKLLSGKCYVDGKPGATYKIFVTAYPKGQPELAFHGECCAEHTDRVRERLLLG